MFTEDLSPTKPRFIETIRYEAGQLHLVPLHEARMLRTLSVHAPTGGLLTKLRSSGLIHILAPYLANLSTSERTKVRFVYDAERIYAPTCTSYTPRVITQIHLCELPSAVCYEYKWENRSCLEVADLGTSEEVLFVRNGLLTDTRFSNIVLQLDGELLTPKTPLLAGVMREHLIAMGRIRPIDLKPEHWFAAEAYYLINAMLPL